MKHGDTLPNDLLWRDDGHVADVVVDVIADGEVTLVPLAALNHVNRCDVCTMRVGGAALLSVDVSDAMREVATAPAASHAAVRNASWPVPVPAIAAAVVLAVIGAVPSLADAPTRMVAFVDSAIDVLPTVVHAMLALGRNHAVDLAPMLAKASMVSVVLLLLTGVAIARAVPRQLPVGGGLR